MKFASMFAASVFAGLLLILLLEIITEYGRQEGGVVERRKPHANPDKYGRQEGGIVERRKPHANPDSHAVSNARTHRREHFRRKTKQYEHGASPSEVTNPQHRVEIVVMNDSRTNAVETPRELIPTLQAEVRPRESTDPKLSKLLSSIRRERRCLPNFYLYGQAEGRKEYASGHVVFIHVTKAGGTTMKRALSAISKEEQLPVTHVSHVEDIRSSYRQFQSRPSDKRTRRNIIAGTFAFGLCDVVRGRPCSYFTVIRDPIDRVISSYLFCQEGEMKCARVSVGFSLTDWAYRFGSRICQQLFRYDSDGNALPLKSMFEDDVVQTADSSQGSMRRTFLHHCISNLENWFAVIGLTEEYELSMRMFEDVYGLPFVKHFQHMNSGQTKQGMPESELEQMRESLRSNSTVMDAMYEDMIIYKRARELFEIQRQCFHNRTMS